MIRLELLLKENNRRFDHSDIMPDMTEYKSRLQCVNHCDWLDLATPTWLQPAFGQEIHAILQ